MSTTRRLMSKITWRWMIITFLSAPNICFPADEQKFGRLFTTRDERQRLQQFREENRLHEQDRDHSGDGTREMGGSHDSRQLQDGSAAGYGATVKHTPVITLKGLIYKKDRAGMVWLNAREGDAALENRKLEPGQVLDNEVTIRVPMTGKSVKLKPGQSYHLHSGAVTDLEGNAP